MCSRFPSHLERAPAMTQRTTDRESETGEQDTPGRPKAGASRQQTQPDQGAQTGNPQVDAESVHEPRHDHHVRNEK